MNGFSVTTAIPYGNAAPHLGHALEPVQADVLARHRGACRRVLDRFPRRQEGDRMDADVIVVGAGLAGLVATTELADACPPQLIHLARSGPGREGAHGADRELRSGVVAEVGDPAVPRPCGIRCRPEAAHTNFAAGTPTASHA